LNAIPSLEVHRSDSPTETFKATVKSQANKINTVFCSTDTKVDKIIVFNKKDRQ